MNRFEFSLNAADFGIPTREELVSLRIWDLHYHGIWPREEDGAVLFYADRMGIERLISLDIAGDHAWQGGQAEKDARHREMLEQRKDRLAGIIRADPSDPERLLRRMDSWIRNGPCIGIKLGLSNPGGVTVSHPNLDPILRAAAELDAVVYIHTWTKVGGEPRRPGGGNNFGESTPMDVAALAQRFPNVPLICGHSGGDWELAARVVRPHRNVYFEFSGSDPHSGSVDYAVKELGADRIVWGGHGPSRSYATELSKVLDSDLNRADRMKVLGGNLRRICEPIFRRKGIPIET